MQIKIIMAILFLSLGIIPLVSASYPDYTYVNSLSSNLTVGTNNIGVIDFIRGTPVGQEYIQNTISALYVKRYDTLLWTGTSSLQIIIPTGTTLIILPNDKVTLSQSGTYTYFLASNASNNATITVAQEDNSIVNIQHSSTPLTITYTTPVTIDHSDVPLNIVVTTNSGMTAGNYPVKFNFTSQYRNYTLDMTFKLSENASWSVVEDTVPVTITAQSNSFKSIGYIKLQSVGNVDTTITSTNLGNATTFLTVQPSQTLFKGAQSYFNVQLQVPNNQADGTFTSVINLTNGVYSYSKKVTVVIKDTTLPTIENLSFSTDSLGVETIAQVIAKDNIGVNYVSINWNGKTENMTKDQQLFTKPYTFTNIDNNVFEICAYDVSGNAYCQRFMKVFPLMNLVLTNTSIQMPSRRTGGFASTTLMTLNSTTAQNVTLTLKEFFSDIVSNTSTLDKFLVQVIDGEGRIATFNTLNQSAPISSKGTITLQVKGNNLSKYGIVFQLSVPQYARTIDPITINGKFQDYDSPRAFNKQIAGTNITCVPTDTGVIETSYQSCTLRMSILDDVENAAIVTTIREQNLQEEKLAFILSDTERSVLYRNIGLSTLAAIAIMSVSYVFYIVRIYPRARFTK